MTDARTEGLQVFRELMPGLIPDGATSLGDGGFADELGEVVYHLTGYAGFPAANAARAVGREVLPQPERRNTKSAK
jgi:hypothetical protein